MTAFAEGISQDELRKLWLQVKRKKPEEALKVYTRICEYFVPKLASTTISAAGDKPLIIERRTVITRDVNGNVVDKKDG